MTTTTKAVEFNVGDKVTVTDPSMGNYGKTGTVTSLKSGYFSWPIKVEFKAGDDASYAESELELVKPPFTFADIQEGDTIRRTQTFKGGATEVREGVAGHKGSYYWATKEDNFILAYDASSEATKGVTLELLNRPEPEPVKEEWETAKPGDRLIVKSKEGITRILTKQPEGDWDCLLIRVSGRHNKGINRDDAAVKGQLAYSGFSNGTPTFIKA